MSQKKTSGFRIKKAMKTTPWWGMLIVFVLSIIILAIASWFPPLKPEYIIEPCKAAVFASLGFLIGYPIGSAKT